MPVCARCTGIYAGAALGVLAYGLATTIGGSFGRRATRRCDPRTLRMIAVAIAVPTALTLAWEWAMLGTPSNGLRAAAGLPLGLFAAWIVMVAVQRDGQSG